MNCFSYYCFSFLSSFLPISLLYRFPLYPLTSLLLSHRFASIFHHIFIGVSSDSIDSVYTRIEGSHVYSSLLILNLSNNSLVLFPTILSRIPALKKIILTGNALGSGSSGKNFLQNWPWLKGALLCVNCITFYSVVLSLRPYPPDLLLSYFLIFIWMISFLSFHPSLFLTCTPPSLSIIHSSLSFLFFLHSTPPSAIPPSFFLSLLLFSSSPLLLTPLPSTPLPFTLLPSPSPHSPLLPPLPHDRYTRLLHCPLLTDVSRYFE